MMEESGHEFRKKKILKYVISNHGLSKEGIVRGMKGDPSRLTVLNILSELEDEKMIVMRTDKPNSQLYRIYPNENNILVTILNELEEFEKAYSKLLDKSKERLQNKDLVLTDFKKLGIKELNPNKWSISNELQFKEFIKENINEQINILQHQIVKVDKVNEQIKQLEIKIDKLIPNAANFFASCFRKPIFFKARILESLLSIDKQLIKNEYLPKLNELKSELADNNIFSHKFYPSYYTDHTLSMLAITIFSLLTEIFTYRSTLVWPTKVYDQQTLQKLYVMVYKKIVDIQLKLTNFINSMKLHNPFFQNNMDLIKAVFLLRKEGRSITSHIEEFTLIYKNVDMKSEYIAVAKTMSNLIKEIEPYGYQVKFINDIVEETVSKLEVRINLLNLILNNNLNKDSFNQLFKNEIVEVEESEESNDETDYIKLFSLPREELDKIS